jgi:hypothetical protein
MKLVPTAALLAALIVTRATADHAKPTDPAPAEVRQRIERLLKELDADDFTTRENAEAALVKVGKPALLPLRKLLAGSPPLEVRTRATRALRAIKRAVARANPVRLDTLIGLATGPDGETPGQARERAQRFDDEIERLLDVLADAKGTAARKPPVRMSGLPVMAPAETVKGGYVRVTGKNRMRTVQNSVVVFERGFPQTDEEPLNCQYRNCIVIAPVGATLTNVQNSIVLARYHVRVWQAEESVILSGFDGWFGLVRDSVCGARDRLTHSHSPPGSRDMLVVNSKIDVSRLPNGSCVARVDGLDLTLPLDNSLDGVVVITFLDQWDSIALFRTRDGKGEYVARHGQSVLDPDGKPIAALDGWRLEYASHRDDIAVFEKDGRHAVLRIVPPGARRGPARKNPVRLTTGEGKPTDAERAKVQKRVERLLKDLKANDRQKRKRAEAALIELGKPALEPLRKLLADSPPEVRTRATRALREIERRHPVRLEEVIALATGPRGETPGQAKERAKRFDDEIERLLEVLADAKGPVARKPLVRMSGLPVVQATKKVDGGYVRITGKTRVRSVRNAIVVIDANLPTCPDCRKCIVILPDSAHLLGEVRKSIVLARYHVRVRHAEESVILSGFDAQLRLKTTSCVCGAGEHLSLPKLQDTLVVNSKNSRAVRVGGLDLRLPLDHSLDGVIEITDVIGLQEGIALFRTRKDGKGEYVARHGQPVLDPDGKLIAALAGWRLEYVRLTDGLAVFAKDGRYAVLPVGKKRRP